MNINNIGDAVIVKSTGATGVVYDYNAALDTVLITIGKGLYSVNRWFKATEIQLLR